MLRVATDENFDGRVLRALLTRLPELDVVRVQDSEVYMAPDPEVLAWAAREGRVLLTHDKKTMVAPVKKRILVGQPVAGVIVVLSAPIGQQVDDLCLAITVFEPEDLRDELIYLPL